MKNKKITIVAVNWWGKDFARLLVDRVKEKSKFYNDIILIDNSKELSIRDFGNSYTVIERIFKPEINLGHAGGLDLAMKMVKTDYVLILDIDAFLLAENWDEKIIEEYEKDERIKLISAEGGRLKPVRPFFMFFERKTIIENDISFKAKSFDGFTFDVGIHAYFQILTKYGDYSVRVLPQIKTNFENVFGHEHSLNGERFVYHNWYGTRWYGKNGEVERKVIDGVKFEDFEKCKKSLFNQVKQI